MKGTLLVLALLVTRELGFQTAEACPLFYEVFSSLSLGNKNILDVALDVANFTEPEKGAMEKIQECYNEKGLIAKSLDTLSMIIISASPECLRFYLNTAEKKLERALINFS